MNEHSLQFEVGAVPPQSGMSDGLLDVLHIALIDDERAMHVAFVHGIGLRLRHQGRSVRVSGTHLRCHCCTKRFGVGMVPVDGAGDEVCSELRYIGHARSDHALRAAVNRCNHGEFIAGAASRRRAL
jgi:hypothetical protein